MTVLEITESKLTKMTELAETMLRAGGKLMQCIEELSERDEYAESASRFEERESWNEVEDGRARNRNQRFTRYH